MKYWKSCGEMTCSKTRLEANIGVTLVLTVLASGDLQAWH